MKFLIEDIKTNKKLFGFTSTLMYLMSTLGFVPLAFAGSLNPATFSDEIKVGETASVNRTVTLDPDIIGKLDILFLADNTGSMGPAIANVKANAQSLLQDLSNTYNDIQIGVAKYGSDPSEFSASYTKYSRSRAAYKLLEPVNAGTISDSVNAINQWTASGGGDWPEANFFALHQAATSGSSINGFYTGYDTKWRSDAKKVIIWFGDAYSHTSTVNQAQAIQALVGNDVTVLAILTQTGSLSLTDGINKNSQATSITSATGGIYQTSTTSALTDTIRSLIVQATSLDLQFETQGNTSGLNISFTCIDSKGCNDVPGGESRQFRMDILGLTRGTYNFTTRVSNVSGAVANDTITVLNQSPTANNSSASTDENTSVNINALTNSTDADGDTVSVTKINGQSIQVGGSVTLSSGALLTLNNDGTFTYNPNDAFDSLNEGQSGNDSFQYTVSDGNEGEASATLTVTITGVNSPSDNNNNLGDNPGDNEGEPGTD
jgi:VCBS repeat-containing protein